MKIAIDTKGLQTEEIQELRVFLEAKGIRNFSALDNAIRHNSYVIIHESGYLTYYGNRNGYEPERYTLLSLEKYIGKPKTMKKSRLKNGDLIVYRDGGVRMLLNDLFMGPFSFSGMSEFDENLKCGYDSNSDIMKVYRTAETFGTSFKIGNSVEETDFGSFEVIWERNEFRPIAVELNNKYGATVYKDNVEVGCQKISFDKCEAIYNAIQKVKNGN